MNEDKLVSATTFYVFVKCISTSGKFIELKETSSINLS